MSNAPNINNPEIELFTPNQGMWGTYNATPTIKKLLVKTWSLEDY